MLEEILEVKNVSKSFQGVQALSAVNFSLRKGEVHALLGENGAGKSTLIKILTGAISKDSGEIYYLGDQLSNISPIKSKKIGINAIYQELTLVPELSIYQNIFLGNEKSRGLTDDEYMISRSEELMEQLQISIDVKKPVKTLTIALQQMVEIARALLFDIKVLIMDEPTSSISKKETEVLFKQIKELSSNGVSIIYISHRMQEIFEICNRITIMRDGHTVNTFDISEVETEDQLVDAMIGSKLENLFPQRHTNIGEEIFRVENLTSTNTFEDISFSVRKGEIFGIGGLVGSKRSEIVESIFCLRKFSSGSIYFHGKEINLKTPKDAIDAGFALLTEDRKGTGLFLQLSVRENVTMPSLKKLASKIGFVNLEQEKTELKKYIESLRIKTPTMNQLIQNLSGGNQQKALISRWIITAPDVLIMDEPTRGIDVNAKSEIYTFMNELTKNGMSIIMISSELPELIAMSDRIMVMHEGRSMGILENKDEITETNVLKMAFGGNIS